MPSTQYNDITKSISCQEPRRLDREDKSRNCPYHRRDDKGEFASKELYESQYAYSIIIYDSKSNKPIDARIVKTIQTYEKFIKSKHERYGLDILLHPNPVVLTKQFYERYRKSKNGAERLQLFSNLSILNDENILFIDTITIDIDSPYDESVKALNELIQLLNIDPATVEIIKTKSSNLRFSFSISPLNPRKRNRNGKTNLENVKEFVSIINSFFLSKGLKADKTFKRVNHPVWITKPQEITKEATQEISFYELYNKAKKLQQTLKLYPDDKRKPTKRERIIKLPAFILNKLQTLQSQTALEKAVETLYENSKGKGTYIHFLQVVAGWSKYLNLSYSEYYDLVRDHLIIDKKREKDIRTAWQRARPLEFKNESKNIKKEYDFVEVANRLISYLEEKGETDRQTLLKEVFYNQKWLEQLITEQLTQEGIIAYEFVRSGRAGRPKKVFKLLKTQEKSSPALEMSANQHKIEFSQYNNSLFRESSLVGRMVIRAPESSEGCPKDVEAGALVKGLFREREIKVAEEGFTREEARKYDIIIKGMRKNLIEKRDKVARTLEKLLEKNKWIEERYGKKGTILEGKDLKKLRRILFIDFETDVEGADTIEKMFELVRKYVKIFNQISQIGVKNGEKAKQTSKPEAKQQQQKLIPEPE